MNKDFYDIYGFKFSVAGPAQISFQKEFRYFSTKEIPDGDLNLIIKPSNRQDLSTIVLRGTNIGIQLPFSPKEKELLYYFKAPHEQILSYTESLMTWEDKTFLHAGVVSKNGKAYIFTGKADVGKTSSVLALLEQGYDYLADDWCVIGNNIVYPFPKTVHLFCYNLSNSTLLKRFPVLFLIKSKFLCFAMSITRKISPHRYFSMLLDKIEPRFDLPITKIFPGSKIGNPCTIKKVFYIERRKVNKVKFSKIQPDNLARRMSYWNFYEKTSSLFREYSCYVQKSGIYNRKIDERLNRDYKILKKIFSNSIIYGITLPDDLKINNKNVEDIFRIDSEN